MNNTQTTRHPHPLRLTEAGMGCIVLPDMFADTLERAILETLAYSDIFKYPLQLLELHRYLPMYIEVEKLSSALDMLGAKVGKKADYYFLPGRAEIVDIREQREARSRSLLPHAMTYGCILGSLPFIRMVTLTGSLAVLNSSENADFDYMLVTAPNRVWTARAFALLFNRLTRLFGHTLCPNLILSENALAWSTHDLYSAREFCQMVPITGIDVYRKLMKANQWVKDFLPNALQTSEVSKTSEVSLQNLLELPLRSRLGNIIESWEMNRKIVRFSKLPGFGEETVFNADMCQGNFDNHKKWTRAALQERLRKLNLESDSLLSAAMGANFLIP